MISGHVYGNIRATLEIERDQTEGNVREAALALDKVKAAVADKTVRRVIVVPNRIVNVVI